MPGIKQVTVIKILRITFTYNLSAAEHVHNVNHVVCQTLYALKVLRAHGMSDSVLQSVYRAPAGSNHLQAAGDLCPFVRPCVRPPVTRELCDETIEHIANILYHMKG